MITFEEFKKIDVRVGTIKSVEEVPETDKLLKLTVDVGEDNDITIVSGIREYFDSPQDLVGKQTPFVLNLEHRVIKGVESQGMLFAVGGESGFALLEPSREIKPGSEVI